MKAIKTLITVAFVLLSINIVSAQYGNNGYGNNGYGNGGYGNGYGNGYGQGGSNGVSRGSMNQENEKPREIPTESTIAKIIDKLKPELNLDDLQVFAISNVLTETIKLQNKIIKAETSQEQKMNDMKDLSQSNDRKIMEFLNKEQKEKYIALNEEQKSKKKKK